MSLCFTFVSTRISLVFSSVLLIPSLDGKLVTSLGDSTDGTSLLRRALSDYVLVAWRGGVNSLCWKYCLFQEKYIVFIMFLEALMVNTYQNEVLPKTQTQFASELNLGLTMQPSELIARSAGHGAQPSDHRLLWFNLFIRTKLNITTFSVKFWCVLF